VSTSDTDDACTVSVVRSFSIDYNGNGHDSGEVPVDEGLYPGASLVTAANPGTMERAGFQFTGWSTSRDGTGFTCRAGETITLGNSDVCLYAQWTAEPAYRVYYDGNGYDHAPVDWNSYHAGASAEVRDQGDLHREGHELAGWNTRPDGLGTAYAPGDLIEMQRTDVHLWAQWNVRQFDVSYSASIGNVDGVAPDSVRRAYGSVFQVADKGSISRFGYEFIGWRLAEHDNALYQPGEYLEQEALDLHFSAAWRLSGTFDPRFGCDGLTTTQLTGLDYPSAVCTLEDDSLLVVGSGRRADDSLTPFIVRYRPDGSLDEDFGRGGAVMDFSNDYKATATAVQDNGRILVARGSDISATRLWPDGSIDTDFGDNGVARADSRYRGNTVSLAIQPDGRLLLAVRLTGYPTAPTYFTYAVARLLPDGSVDESFGTDGVAVHRQQARGDEITGAVLLQPDGKILLSGSGYHPDLGGCEMVVRLTENGSLDNSFGDSGVAYIDFLAGSSRNDHVAHPIALQSDGSILIAGRTLDGSRYIQGLVRLTPDGTVDESFGYQGRATVRYGEAGDEATSIAVQSDQSILLVGSAYDENGARKVTVSRFDPDGARDPSFSLGRRRVIDLGPTTFTTGGRVVIQRSGRIVIAARSYDADKSEILLVGLLP
jgi:uncharacterized delta-60 repeat protein/uncharacterized repeat protein (TIGR02543 family)